MGYNKPITARIQHSTNKGMKVQEPLLDIGSVAKKKELNYGADTSLMSGAENSKFVDIGKAMSEGVDSSKEKPESPATASKYGAMLAANIDQGMSPTEAGKKAAIDIKKAPKAMAKKYDHTYGSNKKSIEGKR